MTKRAHAEELRIAETTSDRIEEKLVAFAEQVGTLVGTVQGRVEGWLDRSTLIDEVSRLRDSANELLTLVSPAAAAETKAAALQTDTPPARRSRGPVDAPGKQHRKPLPPERIDKRMGEPRGKQKGQKSAKAGRRGGRG